MRVAVLRGVFAGLVVSLVLSVSPLSWLVSRNTSTGEAVAIDPFLLLYCADQEIGIRSKLPALQPRIAPFVYGHNRAALRGITIAGLPSGQFDWNIKPVIPEPDDLLYDMFFTSPLGNKAKAYKISDCAVFPEYNHLFLESGMIKKS